MSANRKTKYAPSLLLRLSKATLADLVWELAGASLGDSGLKKANYLLAIAKGRAVEAPKSDLGMLGKIVGDELARGES